MSECKRVPTSADPNSRQRWSPEQDKALVELVQAGMPRKAIADRLQRSVFAIGEHVKLLRAQGTLGRPKPVGRSGRLVCSLHPATQDKLRDRARLRGLTVSALVAQIVEDFLSGRDVAADLRALADLRCVAAEQRRTLDRIAALAQPGNFERKS